MMIKVKNGCYINANQVAIIKLYPAKEIKIFMIHDGAITIRTETEAELEPMFHEIASKIDQLQRQAVK